MEYSDIIKNRYSCRAFEPKEVEEEKTLEIIEAARIAPTGCNYQAFHIWEIKSQEARDFVRANTKCHFGAPNLLIVGVKTSDAWVRRYDGKNIADIDGAIVCTHMLLKIEDLGLATTWVGHFDAPQIKAHFPEMADYELIALFPYGYRKEGPAGDPIPMHFQRKTIDQIKTTL